MNRVDCNPPQLSVGLGAILTSNSGTDFVNSSTSSSTSSSSSSSSTNNTSRSSNNFQIQQQQQQQQHDTTDIDSLAVVGEAARMVSGRSAPTDSAAGPELRTQRGFSCAFDEVLASNRAAVQAANVPGRRVGNSGVAGGRHHGVNGVAYSGGAGSAGSGGPSGASGSYSFILPDLSAHPLEFRAFLEKELLDTGTLVNLEQAGCLNWWHDLGLSQRLWPLQTSGDGNCLLHAVSLSSLGFHDRQLVFRSALHEYLLAHSAAVYRRWRWQTARELYRSTGLRLSETEWQVEWKSLLQLASTQPKQQQQQSTQLGQQQQHQLDSLEEIHVFVAANVFRRPILVIADQFVKDADGDNLAPIPFAGIYLPLLEKPEHCSKHPVLLAYDAAHFSALVPMEASPGSDAARLPYAVPLCCCDLRTPLPLHFSTDPGTHWKWSSKSAAAAIVGDSTPADVEIGGRLRAKLLAAYLRCSALRLPTAVVAPAAVAAATLPPQTRLARSGSSVGNVALAESSSMAITAAAASGETSAVEFEDVFDQKQQQQHSQKHAFLQQRSATLDGRRMRLGGPGSELFPGDLPQSPSPHSGRSLGQQLLKAMQQRLPIKRAARGAKWFSPAPPTAAAGSASMPADCAGLASSESSSGSAVLLCAHLGVTNRPPHFTDAVSSYLVSAKARFLKLDELQKRQSAEIVRLIGGDQQQQQRRSALMQCVGPNCDMFAREDTNFLCSRCYRDQRLLMTQILTDK